jgi:hypothetical protein
LSFVISLCFSFGHLGERIIVYEVGRERREMGEDLKMTKRIRLLTGYLLSVPGRNSRNLIGPRSGINKDFVEPNEIN